MEEIKTISDLIAHLKYIEEEYGDLEVCKMFGERVYDLNDLVTVQDENDCIEFSM